MWYPNTTVYSSCTSDRHEAFRFVPDLFIRKRSSLSVRFSLHPESCITFDCLPARHHHYAQHILCPGTTGRSLHMNRFWVQEITGRSSRVQRITQHFRGIYGIYLQFMKASKPDDGCQHVISRLYLGFRVLTDYLFCPKTNFPGTLNPI